MPMFNDAEGQWARPPRAEAGGADLRAEWPVEVHGAKDGTRRDRAGAASRRRELSAARGVRRRWLLAGALFALLAACAPPAAAPSPVVQAGRRLYLAKGCAQCHGQDAEGTGVAPAIGGHGAAVVKRQVRGPVGSMPRFGPEQISDQELDQIADYIAAVAPTERHHEPTQMADMVAMHHWMALVALKAGDRSEAEHHVRHVTESVTGEHSQQMENALRLMREGKLHDAEHQIEHMLAGTASPGLTLPHLHLRAALSALAADDGPDARHHMEHFMGMAAGRDQARGEEILARIERGDLHGVEHEIEELLPRR